MAATPRGAAASEQLTRALINLAAVGLRTHCSDLGSTAMLLSEYEAERAHAARLCRGCPGLGPCDAAAASRGEKIGVWGAKDRTPPKPKVAA